MKRTNSNFWVLISRVVDPACPLRHKWCACWKVGEGAAQTSATPSAERTTHRHEQSITRTLNELTDAQANLALVGLPPYDILDTRA